MAFVENELRLISPRATLRQISRLGPVACDGATGDYIIKGEINLALAHTFALASEHCRRVYPIAPNSRRALVPNLGDFLVGVDLDEYSLFSNSGKPLGFYTRERRPRIPLILQLGNIWLEGVPPEGALLRFRNEQLAKSAVFTVIDARGRQYEIDVAKGTAEVLDWDCLGMTPTAEEAPPRPSQETGA